MEGNPMSSHNLMLLKVECIHFFEENPYALETTTSLASRLGRNESLIVVALTELVNLSILYRFGEGDEALYRYIEPSMTKGKMDAVCKES